MKYLIILSVVFLQINVIAQIKVNQVGFPLKSKKLAVIPDNGITDFTLIDDNQNIVFTGQLSTAKADFEVGKFVRIADFSSFETPGTYRVSVGNENSYSFRIAKDVYLDILSATIKAYYFNRASTELLPEHAGEYARAGGHFDTEVPLVTNYSKLLDVSKGWYDAGDYGKYVVPAGITIYTMLALYEYYPELMDNVSLNIPESSNSTPDILDEVYWELAWLLKMQDVDGGVYHKVTAMTHSDFVMPDQDLKQRYVTGKSAPATLNVASVMAMASRIYKKFPVDYPGADTIFLNAAEKAWAFYKKNPTMTSTDPTRTGTYFTGGSRIWTEVELAVTKEQFGAISYDYIDFIQTPLYYSVDPLGLITMSNHSDKINPAVASLVNDRILEYADSYLGYYSTSSYKLAHDGTYDWGSNAWYGNTAMMLIQAYRITKDKKYLEGVMGNLDYLLGKNPTGYCYVTGFGSKSPQNIHHRVSASDDIEKPVPGFLVGGPTGISSPSCPSKSFPSQAHRYIDDTCSYTTNEVAIYWNAPLVYILGVMSAIYNPEVKPIISNQPSSIVYYELQNKLTLTIELENHNVGTIFQWYKDGNSIGENSSKLIISNAQKSDTGYYSAKITNEFGITYSNEYRLVPYMAELEIPNPINVPFKVEAEDYSSNLPMQEFTVGNSGGTYRNGNVDIYPIDSNLTEFYVSFTRNANYQNEFLSYRLNFLKASKYKIKVIAKSKDLYSFGSVTLSLDNSYLGSDYLRNNAGWGVIEFVPSSIISAGQHTLKLEATDIDIDYLIFEGQWTDCKDIQSGLNELDNCEICREITDPDFDHCIITNLHTPDGSKFTLFPNPAGNSLNVAGNLIDVTKLEISNLEGRIVKEIKYPATQINIADLISGVYIVKLVTGKESLVIKFIKE
jgi:endoglucanase